MKTDLPDMPAWLAPLAQALEPWLPALTASGLVMAVVSFFAIPWFLVRLPADYFLLSYHPREHRGPLAWIVWLTRNVIALLLLLTGIVMLVLPGQGLLTVFIAIMISTFPGKYRLQTAIIRRPGVFRAVNWIRRRYHHEPLQYPVKETGSTSPSGTEK